MNSRRFLKKLGREIPDWIERGWLTRENSERILAHIADNSGASNLLASAVAILGVLLLGSGIITYFAANWDDMTKLFKLLTLFGSLYLSYGMALFCLNNDAYPRVGQALLLLGVILFGANIMLIAQIYHIDEHYPNGVLMWSLGGVLTAWLLRAQAAMVAAIVLAVLWTGMESFGFDRLHLGFLLLWFALLPVIYLRRWRVSQHMVMIALLLWSLFSFNAVNRYYEEGGVLYQVQLYLVIYLALFVTGMLFKVSTHLRPFADTVMNYSIFAVLAGGYTLTFPRLQSGLRWSFDDTFREAAGNIWVIDTFIALTVLATLAVWHRYKTMNSERPRYLVYGEWLITAIILLIVTNLFLGGVHGSWIALAFNLLFFGGVIWLVFAGMYTHNRFQINIAFTFFALALLSRYFDTFWTLLNRSFFFMGGGLILIIGGYLLEQQRRRLTGAIKSGLQGTNG